MEGEGLPKYRAGYGSQHLIGNKYVVYEHQNGGQVLDVGPSVSDEVQLVLLGFVA
jgi:hypothetical protein